MEFQLLFQDMYCISIIYRMRKKKLLKEPECSFFPKSHKNDCFCHKWLDVFLPFIKDFYLFTLNES